MFIKGTMKGIREDIKDILANCMVSISTHTRTLHHQHYTTSLHFLFTLLARRTWSPFA